MFVCVAICDVRVLIVILNLPIQRAQPCYLSERLTFEEESIDQTVHVSSLGNKNCFLANTMQLSSGQFLVGPMYPSSPLILAAPNCKTGWHGFEFHREHQSPQDCRYACMVSYLCISNYVTPQHITRDLGLLRPVTTLQADELNYGQHWRTWKTWHWSLFRDQSVTF